MSTRHRPLRACVAFAMLGAGAAAGPSQGGGGTTPADLIPVDFLVVGTDGQPIPGLTRDDLALKLDGKPREIRSLEFVPFAEGNSGHLAPRRRPLPPPFGTNVLADAGRIVMIVVEHESIRPGKERPLGVVSRTLRKVR